MRSLWRGLRVFIGLSWRADPRKTLMVLALAVVDAVFASLTGLWLKLLTDGALEQDLAKACTGAVGAAVGIASMGAGQLVGGMLRATIVDRAVIILEHELVTLTTDIPGIEHHERVDYLDRLQLLRQEGPSLVDSAWALVDLASLFARILGTTLLLASLHPLLLLLPLLGLPSLFLGGRAQRIMQRAAERTAEAQRLETELLNLALSAAPAKEIRVFGLSEQLDRRCRRLWDQVTNVNLHAQVASSLLHLCGVLLFAAGYLAAVAWVAVRVAQGESTVGDLALIVAVGQQVRSHAGGAVRLVTQALTISRAMQRYLWLREYSRDEQARSGRPEDVPDRLRQGIRFADVSFAYPGTDAPVLTGLDLFLPAGSTIAIVGENGAGKTSLVKLLCRFYRPTAGKITVDGADLANLDVTQWRARLAAGFQDFVRFELLARQTVGVGDLPLIDDREAVLEALDRADGRAVVDALPAGLDNQLGRQFESGSDLSTGQWQRLALARATMRRTPLLLMLDEPTSALDAAAEHHLFARYAAAARDVGTRTGAITILVSHRFSTVRNADLIIVIDKGRLVEVGDHETLIASGGLYSELYELQAASYR